MKTGFYLDYVTGEACYYDSKRISGKYSKELQAQLKAQAKEYWESLTEAQKQIISWCRQDKVAQNECLGIAQVRERKLDEFYRIIMNTNITPKKIEKYEEVYKHFEDFKLFVHKK